MKYPTGYHNTDKIFYIFRAFLDSFRHFALAESAESAITYACQVAVQGRLMTLKTPRLLSLLITSLSLHIYSLVSSFQSKQRVSRQYAAYT